MKKLLIVAAASGALFGCANLPSLPTLPSFGKTNTTAEPTIKVVQATSTSSKASKAVSAATHYRCTENATVVADYLPKDGIAKLLVNAPSWKINNQTITMTSAVSGSGARFVNDTNPNSLYEWHTKGRDGLLSVKIAGSTYTLTCSEVAH